MSSKNKFKLCDDTLEISRDKWCKIAFTSYREDYCKEITKYTWGEKNGYLHSGKLGYLHRYIMGKWYGQDVLDEMTKAGFVVDHMDNNGFECRIENLYFLAKNENTAKGLTLDIQIEEMRPRIALSIYRDFSTGLFQITMFFNVSVSLCKGDEMTHISAIRLL